MVESFIVLGLFFDLFGAFLLSIPLVLNAKKLAHSLLRLVQKFRWFFLRPPSYRMKYRLSYSNLNDYSVLVGVNRAIFLKFSFLLGFCFIIIKAIFLSIYNQDYSFFTIELKDKEYHLIPNLIEDYESYILVGVIFISIFLLLIIIYYLLSKIPVLFFKFFIFVAKGNHEKKVGVIGLCLLCMGFITQSCVNLYLLQN